MTSDGLAPDVPARLQWLQALHDPSMALRWSLAEWERVVRISRRLRLLARIAERIDSAGILGRVPAPVRRHLVSAQRVSKWRQSALLWALERIEPLFPPSTYPRVLLKGAAYMGQGLPIAAGRVPADLDILVPREHIDDAQSRLIAAGWAVIELDPHDERYYYDWSHEIPPLRHPAHRIELDLHHNILPPVAKTRVDADVLLERLRPSRWPSWQVLDPTDQILHSAAHLFLDSEARDRIRDLVDLDGLIRHFASEPAAFWPCLVTRAKELGLEEPLALACHFCVAWLGTPIPEDARTAIAAIGPGPVRRAWLLPLLESVLMPCEPDDVSPLTQGMAAALLLVRYQRQRLPLRLLVPHAWHKLGIGRRQRHAFPEEPVEP